MTWTKWLKKYWKILINLNVLKNLIIKLFNRYRNLILYGLIGGFCAGLDFAVYTLLCKINVQYLVANVVGIHCGIFCSFILNRHINFRVKDKMWTRFTFFYLIGLIGLALSSGMLYYMVTMSNWDEISAKLITVVTVALVQFFLNKLITFKKTILS